MFCGFSGFHELCVVDESPTLIAILHCEISNVILDTSLMKFGPKFACKD